MAPRLAQHWETRALGELCCCCCLQYAALPQIAIHAIFGVLPYCSSPTWTERHDLKTVQATGEALQKKAEGLTGSGKHWLMNKELLLLVQWVSWGQAVMGLDKHGANCHWITRHLPLSIVPWPGRARSGCQLAPLPRSSRLRTRDAVLTAFPPHLHQQPQTGPGIGA